MISGAPLRAGQHRLGVLARFEPRVDRRLVVDPDDWPVDGDQADVEAVFRELGSNANPILTQLAKTKRAVFVEGLDFQIISQFARKLGFNVVANRASFAVLPMGGFNPDRAKTLKEGVELTLGSKVRSVAILDRDFDHVLRFFQGALAVRLELCGNPAGHEANDLLFCRIDKVLHGGVVTVRELGALVWVDQQDGIRAAFKEQAKFIFTFAHCLKRPLQFLVGFFHPAAMLRLLPPGVEKHDDSQGDRQHRP
jgi:hypothetical protein